MFWRRVECHTAEQVSKFPGTHRLRRPGFVVLGTIGMHFVNMPVFVQRQVPRVQVLQNCAARFRTACVRVFRRGVQFVNIVDVGFVEQLQTFMVQKH